jgi:hypothetical protein
MNERLGTIIYKLERSRSAFSSFDPPNSSGIYAFFLKEGSSLHLLGPNASSHVYIGRTSDLFARQINAHFNTNGSGSSTVRRTLGSILKKTLHLVAIPRNDGKSDRDFINYRFDDDGEKRVTDWMTSSLDVGICSLDPKDLVLEKELISLLKPVLNLTGWKNPDRKEIKRLRKSCADEARSSIRRAPEH